MNTKAPISVVIPCYCCADTIERAMESVMAQTVLPTEVWLVEDGSPDEGQTLAKLRELEGRYEGSGTAVNILTLGQNLGAAAARNAGWNAGGQPYVAFLDADDAWHPAKLEVQYGWMRDHPDVAMTGHGWVWVRFGRPPTLLQQDWSAWRVSRCRQLMFSSFYTPTVMLHCNLPYRFSETRLGPGWVLEDIDLWLRIVLDGNPAWRLDVVLTYLGKAPFGEGGLSGHLWRMEKGELNAYWRQVREGRLHPFFFGLVASWSMTKYLRRLVLVRLGRWPESR